LLPNFFIVGAGKAGTTSLHAYLAQHPQVYMSPVKEPCYFADEIRAKNLSADLQVHVRKQSTHLAARLNDGGPARPYGWLAQDLDEYQRLFAQANGARAVGESSAAYLWSPSASRNIRGLIPGAKIVMILRDPAERAYSQYLHQLAVGLTRSTFREHVRQSLESQDRTISPLYPFLEIGLYHEQVKRYLDAFPREQIRIYWYEEDWRRPEAMLADLLRFVGVDDTRIPDTSQRSLERRAPRSAAIHYFMKRMKVWYPLRAMVPEAWRPALKRLAFRTGKSLAMEPADRRLLVDYYREDIQKLAGLLDRDLSTWLHAA